MLLTVSHLRAVVEFETTMKRALPKTWVRFTPGFLRYEESTVDTERVSWEYVLLLYCCSSFPFLFVMTVSVSSTYRCLLAFSDTT